MINLSNQILYRINNLNNESERISTQISTGKNVNVGSDDSVLFARYINIENKLKEQEGLSLQLNKISAQNEMSDAIMDDVKTTITNIKSDVLRSLNAGMSSADRGAVATNIDGMRESLLRLVNTQVDGEYIYSGSNSTKKPFEIDEDFAANGKIKFCGNSHLRNISVDVNNYKERGISAVDVLMYNTNTSSENDTIKFKDGEKIFDQLGNEWAFIDYDNIDGDNNKLTGVDKDRIYKLDANGEPTIENILTFGDGNNPEYFKTESISDSLLGNRIKDNTASGLLLEVKHNFFEDLNVIINALKGYDTNLEDGEDNGKQTLYANKEQVDEILSNYLGKIDEQYTATNIGHAELGGRNKILENYEESIASKITHYNILLQETNGADLAKLAMESKTLEMTYSALFTTVTKMNQMSLVNFIN